MRAASPTHLLGIITQIKCVRNVGVVKKEDWRDRHVAHVET